MSEHAHAEHDTNYVQIYVVLLVLFAVSVAGPMLEIPWLTLVTAFGIACVKAFLVCANFMHLRTEAKLVTYMLFGMLALMGLMFAGVAPDVLTHSGTRWEKTVEVEIPPAPGHHDDGHDGHGDHQH